MLISKASGRSYKHDVLFAYKTKTFTGSKTVLNIHINLKQTKKNWKTEIEILHIKGLLFLPSTVFFF